MKKIKKSKPTKREKIFFLITLISLIIAVGAIVHAQTGQGHPWSEIICSNCIKASNIDTSEVQKRVSGSCSSGYSIRKIYSDGTVDCEYDTDTHRTCSSCDSRFVEEISPGTDSDKAPDADKLDGLDSSKFSQWEECKAGWCYDNSDSCSGAAKVKDRSDKYNWVIAECSDSNARVVSGGCICHGGANLEWSAPTGVDATWGNHPAFLSWKCDCDNDDPGGELVEIFIMCCR